MWPRQAPHRSTASGLAGMMPPRGGRRWTAAGVARVAQLGLPQLGGTLAGMPVPVHIAGGAPALAASLRELSARLAGVRGARGARGQRALNAAALPIRIAGWASTARRPDGRLPTVRAEAWWPHRTWLVGPLNAADAPVLVTGHAAPPAAALGQPTTVDTLLGPGPLELPGRLGRAFRAMTEPVVRAHLASPPGEPPAGRVDPPTDTAGARASHDRASRPRGPSGYGALPTCRPLSYPAGRLFVPHRGRGNVERLEIPRRRFHDLRHTCAPLLLARGVPLHEVSEVLGHTAAARAPGTSTPPVRNPPARAGRGYVSLPLGRSAGNLKLVSTLVGTVSPPEQ
jgi:hypothetical protein